jgi:hypothetical protein
MSPSLLHLIDFIMKGYSTSLFLFFPVFDLLFHLINVIIFYIFNFNSLSSLSFFYTPITLNFILPLSLIIHVYIMLNLTLVGSIVIFSIILLFIFRLHYHLQKFSYTNLP